MSHVPFSFSCPFKQSRYQRSNRGPVILWYNYREEQNVPYSYDDELSCEDDHISSKAISGLYLKAPVTQRLQVDLIHPNFSAHILM